MAAPSIFQTGQYLLDLSFENFALTTQAAAPTIQVNVNVDASGLNGAPQAGELASGEYESVLMLNVTARDVPPGGKPDVSTKPLFILEMRYGARYRIEGISMTDLEQFLLIEAPRMLFPFARQVAADAVAHGGLPPLLLTPIDFGALYEQQRRKAA